MATPSFDSALIAKLKAATAWRFSVQLQPVFTPRFFCCTDPNDLGISDGKAPVAILDLSPNPGLVADSISFDGSDSYDPDGTVTGYSWTFEDGTPATSSSASGTVTWADVGEYEVTLIVTDGTGLKSTPARVVMVVTDPTGKYYMATENGVWYTADGGDDGWTAKNSGLSGTALNVNDIKIDPATQALDDDSKTVWIATDDGIYISNDGAGSWSQNNPSSVSNDFSDSPAPTVGDLDFMKLHFANDVLYASANWLNGASNERSFVFYADASAARKDPTGDLSWAQMTIYTG